MKTQNETVLIVDDEKEIQDSIASQLSNHQIQCLKASSAEEALDILSRNTVNVIISDINMPNMKGTSFASKILAEVSVPIIFVTGNTDHKVIIDSLRLGAFDYIEKPANLHQIEESAFKALNFQQRQASAGEVNSELNDKMIRLLKVSNATSKM